MAEDKMQNPYEKDGIAQSEIAIGRGAACALIAAFVLILLLPPLYRNVYQLALGGDDAWVPVVEIFRKPKDQKITEHLKSFENDLEDKAAFTEPPRQFVQGALAGSLREGNRKTYIGRDGWLYLKPALDAITGYGPLTPEPDSVAKDPNRKPWSAPLGAIKNFAAQLEELGVELVLVPIPIKPMIYPEHLTGKQHDHPLQHRDAAEFYEQIETLPNARVIDLSEAFWSEKENAPLFLKQDTHWTPKGMQLAAAKVAAIIGTGTSPTTSLDPPVEVRSVGDLVEQLNLPRGGMEWFMPETALVQAVTGFVPDPTAKVTLLGDSFTNIYSSKSLDWGEDAGFAEHLAHRMGQPLDVIAINGQASTGVRKELAMRGKDHLKKKKTVIWAIATRDLFLSETAARENNVEWDDVVIPVKPPSTENSDAIEVTATLVSMSAIADPNKVTYKNALFVSQFERVDNGESILIKEWAFRDKEMTPASERVADQEVTFQLVPFDSQAEGKGEQTFDDYDADVEMMLLPRYWPLPTESADAAPDQTSKGNPKRANTIAAVVCLLATIGVTGLARRLRR
jgi:lysophospholipase L1-like esterase